MHRCLGVHATGTMQCLRSTLCVDMTTTRVMRAQLVAWASGVCVGAHGARQHAPFPSLLRTTGTICCGNLLARRQRPHAALVCKLLDGIAPAPLRAVSSQRFQFSVPVQLPGSTYCTARQSSVVRVAARHHHHACGPRSSASFCSLHDSEHHAPIDTCSTCT